MNSKHKPDGRLAQLLRGVRSAFKGSAADDVLAAGDATTLVTSAAAPMPTASELINEGLRQRQEHGVAAAQPFFEAASQLEPGSHVPFFMLGNVASELGDLDTAVRHYEHARDLQPSDHIVRYNLGLNHLWRGYVDSAIEELRVACKLNPAYLQAQSTYIMALHNSDRVSPEEIAATTRAWGVQFALQHPEAGQANIAFRRAPPESVMRWVRLRRLSDALCGAFFRTYRERPRPGVIQVCVL